MATYRKRQALIRYLDIPEIRQSTLSHLDPPALGRRYNEAAGEENEAIDDWVLVSFEKQKTLEAQKRKAKRMAKQKAYRHRLKNTASGAKTMSLAHGSLTRNCKRLATRQAILDIPEVRRSTVSEMNFDQLNMNVEGAAAAKAAVDITNKRDAEKAKITGTRKCAAGLLSTHHKNVAREPAIEPRGARAVDRAAMFPASSITIHQPQIARSDCTVLEASEIPIQPPQRNPNRVRVPDGDAAVAQTPEEPRPSPSRSSKRKAPDSNSLEKATKHSKGYDMPRGREDHKARRKSASPAMTQYSEMGWDLCESRDRGHERGDRDRDRDHDRVRVRDRDRAKSRDGGDRDRDRYRTDRERDQDGRRGRDRSLSPRKDAGQGSSARDAGTVVQPVPQATKPPAKPGTEPAVQPITLPVAASQFPGQRDFSPTELDRASTMLTGWGNDGLHWENGMPDPNGDDALTPPSFSGYRENLQPPDSGDDDNIT
ncbi:hypothetical protein CDD83_2875 [Cordyceps sp. RAO-2017]|nr:hypothetical protein CDD83_2875 [Cordyceps sp. RAO-2017]